MSRMMLSLILLTALISHTLAVTDAETEIQLLIHAVRESSCDFDRNGTLYSAETAAEHLELEYTRGKRYADSAEAFIEHLATGSSWSGEPYWMICDGDKISSAEWLAEQLEGSRAQ
ncbi:MAG: DUF5329 family protein [Luminiphilus sp.]